MWKFRAHLFDRNGERIELTRGPPLPNLSIGLASLGGM